MTVPQQRSQQQPWPSTVAQQQRQPTPPQAQHRLVPVEPSVAPATGGSTAMSALRVTTYVLTSIASLLFILLVIYGAVKVGQLQDALSSSPFGSGVTSSSYEGGYTG